MDLFSGNDFCVRLLFEAGPEYYEKSEWARGWNRSFPLLAPDLQNGSELGWFKDEHQDLPVKVLKIMSQGELKGPCKRTHTPQRGPVRPGPEYFRPRLSQVDGQPVRKAGNCQFRTDGAAV